MRGIAGGAVEPCLEPGAGQAAVEASDKRMRGAAMDSRDHGGCDLN
jgi:hypothetical protein